MKNIKGIFAMILAIALFIVSCQDEAPELNAPLAGEQINFEVTQPLSIDAGGNTVVLRNLSQGVIALWDYGTGKTQKQVDTVRYAFKGTYTIKRKAMTGGRLVELPDITVEVTKDNLLYVNDPLWTLLTGGVGNAKTWLMDANEKTESKFFTSPVFFAGMDNAYGSIAEDGQSVFWSKVCEVTNSPNCWTYEPNYKNDTWAAPPLDYGTMTFSLQGGPFVKTDHKGVAGVGTESGTFFLDVNSKTLSITDATPLTVSYGPSDAATLNSVRIISLTENTMQLAFKNKAKSEYFVINYISKEYSDKWVAPPPAVPTIDEGFDPEFAAGELLEMLAGGPGSGKQWKLDVNGNPVDWVKTGKGFTTSAQSSWNWGWNDSWIAATTGAWIMFDRFGGKQNYTRYQNGATTTGTFTINEGTNEITLNTDKLLVNPDSWMSPASNIIKVVKAFPDDFSTKGIWFGTNYDTAKDEWLAFHYILP